MYFHSEASLSSILIKGKRKFPNLPTKDKYWNKESLYRYHCLCSPTSVYFSCTAGKVRISASASVAWIFVYPGGAKCNKTYWNLFLDNAFRIFLIHGPLLSIEETWLNYIISHKLHRRSRSSHVTFLESQ